MREVGIIGYGAFGKQIETFLKEEQRSSGLQVSYFDDAYCESGASNSYPFNAFQDDQFKELFFYIGLGYKHLVLRQRLCEQLLQNGSHLPSFVHRTTYVNPTAKIGAGVYIYPMCTIDQEVEIGVGTMLNNSVTLSHNTIIDACSFIAPGVTIAGNVRVGKHCFVGSGSVIANNVSVGSDVKIGIGTVVTKNIDESCSVIGNPMKILNKPFVLT